MGQRNVFGKILPLLFWLALTGNGFALGEFQFVTTTADPDGFPICEKNSVAPISVDTNDFAGVVRAAGDLQTDIAHVTGLMPKMLAGKGDSSANVILIGTIGKSRIIDGLIRKKKIDVSEISNKWESFFLQVVPQPLPGINRALVICGSDKRGTIYGIYDLSEQVGVSPWHYWADVPMKHHDQLFIKPGKYVQGPPSVKYRGIFLNDEAPDLSNWIQKKYGTAPGYKYAANYGPAFYTNLFELMLRIRANYLWPAMWNNAFNEDDTNNPRLADEYGIVMGTSHQEPMMRAQKEWDRKYSKQYGSWNYAKIPIVVSNFWRAGMERNKNYENLTTIGLRGANDTPMAEGGPEANRDLLEKIVGDQRNILADVINPDVTKIPQVWCLYKEVMDYYNAGMRVPEDVTLLWAEDNWGNVRRLPTPDERHRSGGAGIYYHFDYHGGPRNYQWLNTSPIPKIWDQMSLAKQYGADRVWIVNVGHFKGYEFPLEFFMHLAWNTDRWTNENLDEYTHLWAEREFGPEHAGQIAQIISTYTKFNGRRKPELLDATTYSLLDYREFETVVTNYQSLASEAEKLGAQLPAEFQDAYYELVLFPTKACAQLNALYLAAAKNALYAKQGRASANDFAAQTHALFTAQTNLMDHFNRVFAGGKWNHFMDQPFIGYQSWNEPPQNNLKAITLTNLNVPDDAAMGVAAEGSAGTTDGTLAFDKFGQTSRYVDVFNRGKTAFKFTASATAPWIILSETGGNVQTDQRLPVSVDWSKTPIGRGNAAINFSGAGTNLTVNVSIFNPAEPVRESLQGFIEADGYVSIEAEHFTKKSDAGTNRWIKIPDYGHTLSGMRATGPADVLVAPGKDSPCLEYKMYLFNSGTVEVESFVGPTLNFIPGRPLRFAVSFDNEPPQTVTIVPADFDARNGNHNWEESVKNNGRRVKSMHTIGQTGYHTLKIWMIDPAVVLEKIVVNTGGVKPSYLGPPESFHGATFTSASPR